MDKVYWEFTGETRVEFGIELKQIRAACDFGFATKGDLGGWLSDAVILAQNGRAWIGKNAKAFHGIIRGGTIEGGTIWGGTIEGGTILGGAIRGGTIEGGTILGGTIEGGTIEGGTIWGGTIEGGTIRGGTIEGGTIRGGTILGGTIEGGTIQGGTILGGTIEGGTIQGGTIEGGDFLTVSPIGSEDGQFTAGVTEGGKILCNRGCFRGTLEEFEAAVTKTHGDNKLADEYRLVVQLVRLRLGPIAAKRKAALEQEAA